MTIDKDSFTLTESTLSQTTNNLSQGQYQIDITPELESLLNVTDQLNKRVQVIRKENPELWSTLLTKLRVDWTHHSTSLEGSTLSRGETHFFLMEGLTVEGKPFKDFLDARNHAEAIDFLYDILNNRRLITEGLIKELNALLLAGVTYTWARDAMGQAVKKKATPGQYKTQSNHVLQADGTIHQYVDPVHVDTEMAALVDWLQANMMTYHPLIVAAMVHYHLVRIHPFDDGNGRGARILMNLVLLNHRFFPVIIHTERKRAYLDALQQADSGDLVPFIYFLAQELITTQERVLADAQAYSHFD